MLRLPRSAQHHRLRRSMLAKIKRRVVLDWARQAQVLDQDMVITVIYRILFVLAKALTNIIR